MCKRYACIIVVSPELRMELESKHGRWVINFFIIIKEVLSLNRSQVLTLKDIMTLLLFQGGSGYVKKINFQKITLTAAENPIIIDQHYCEKGCNNQVSIICI